MNRHWMETQNLVISFDYSWFLAKNLAYAKCCIMKFHYRNSSNCTHTNLILLDFFSLPLEFWELNSYHLKEIQVPLEYRILNWLLTWNIFRLCIPFFKCKVVAWGLSWAKSKHIPFTYFEHSSNRKRRSKIRLGRITTLDLCRQTSKFASVLFDQGFQIWVSWNWSERHLTVFCIDPIVPVYYANRKVNSNKKF